MVVNQPVTERPKVPSLGRLGLVDARASANLAQLGWNTEARIDLLWSLSRAPDADAALCAMVRLAEALGDDWDELNAALAADRRLRGRLFGVLGSSLALGDHLVANPQAWHLLQGTVKLPSAEQLSAPSPSAWAKLQLAQARWCRDYASSTATGCWCWPLWIWRRQSRTSPCCLSALSVPTWPI